ncbi:MAG TPA: SUMF1/EgtB/PvdO family nonheme iron enzyme [Thermoanaerobaculia bacterium]|nr:SUMF1/EgtB/PvdO family nonheme iron enzyme [Thermoanaerobaculia bacterium]
MPESTDPDLVLRVTQETLANGQQVLRFVAKTREPLAGFYFDSFDSAPFRQGAPEDHFGSLFRYLSWVHRGGSRDWFAGNGTLLFKELLPLELRRGLWALVNSVRTLQILSDEVWFPWELLRLQDPDKPSSSAGPFLVEAFSVTRWLLKVRQGAPPVLKLPMKRIALIVPRDSTLPHVSVERERVKGFGGAEREVVEVQALYPEVKNALASGEYDGLHFAGHGYAWEGSRCSLLLERGGQLDPEHLHGLVRIGSGQPLVFLNACHSGRGTASLSGMGGLASAFLEAGAGAFIGSHWELKDSQALCFAEELYKQLFDGVELGEAVRQARLILRDRFPEGDGWLAYTVFAHPLARCSAAAKAPAEEPARQNRKPRPEKKSKSPVAPAAKPASEDGKRFSPIPVVEPPVLETRSPKEPTSAGERIHEKDGTVLVYVAGGEFTLGAEGFQDARPVHRVRLSPFWIGKLPVTNEQFARFLEENPDVPKPAFWDDPQLNPSRHPVVGLSWDDAQAYCRWAGLELPSEAQWEAAARSTEQRRYPWGRELPTPRHARFGTTSGTAPVGACPAGASPYGTLDQTGNVWEWCADPWSPTAYREREKRELDPVGQGDSAVRAVRGGSWNTPAQDLPAAFRGRRSAKMRFNDQGFRCIWRPV